MMSWEVWDEDEERVEEEEEHVEGTEETVSEDVEAVVKEDAEVVARPKGDPLLEYVYGLTREPPSSTESWQVAWMIAEMRKASRLGREREAKRWAELVFRFCPLKPRLCPIYTTTISSCRSGSDIEKRCRARAWRGVRK